MIQVWKEVLLPSPRQFDARGREFSITPGNVRDAYRNVRLMLSRGVPIPCIAEHLDVEAGDTEEWKARYVKNTFGHISDARIGPGGSLELRHDLRDEEAVRTLARCRFVSPKIYPSYSDSRGGTYRGTTIAHVAVTPTPVQFWQKPFELSSGDALYLAYSPAATPPEAEKCPPQTLLDDWLDTLDAPISLSTTEVPEMADDDKKGPPKSDDKGGGDGGQGGDLKMIIDAIKKAYPQANIPAEVSNWSELALVLKAQSGGDAEPEEPEAPPDTEGAGDGTTPPPGGPPMLMSTTDRDPRRKAKAESWARDEREDVKARVEALLTSRRVDRPTYRRLLRNTQSVEMSFTAHGDLSDKNTRWDKLLAEVAAAEKKPANSVLAAPAIDLSATVAPARPDQLAADRKAEEDLCVAEQAALARKHSPVQKAK